MTPTDINADTGAGELVVSWPDGRVDRLGFRHLRLACRCAYCVDEMTGKRLLDPDTIPETLSVKELAPVGRYALKIGFSDGHDTGLYTWTHLRELAESSAA